MTQYVLLNDDQTAVRTLFGSPQDDQTDYAEIADDDARYLAYVDRQNLPAIYASKLAGGIAITSTGTPAISGTYALDQLTLDQIGSVARDAGSGLGLPGDLTSFAYPDIDGAPHAFAAADIQHLYKAMRDLVFAMSTTAATLAAGGSADWPAQSKTIA